MPFYHTGLLVKPSEVKVIKNYCKKLTLRFEDDPTKRFWCSTDECSLTQKSSFKAHKDNQLELLNHENIPLQEILIFSKSKDEMQNYLSLIKTGIFLGTTVYSMGLETILEEGEKSHYLINNIETYWNQYNHCEGIDIGFYTLNQVIDNDVRCIYALEKYRFSIESEGFNPYSANPRYGQLFDNNSPIYSEHVNQLMAIVSAYSVIEELGCEIRSSKENPRFLDNQTCQWNDKVWKETENRLQSKNIDTSYKFQWTLRGGDTIIHKDFKYHLFGEESPSNDRAEVKDRMLHIIEAIQFSSYLRNMVAAHKFTSKSSAISPYDLHNVQMVARYLIMQYLGIWDYIRETNQIKSQSYIKRTNNE